MSEQAPEIPPGWTPPGSDYSGEPYDTYQAVTDDTAPSYETSQ